MMSSYEGPDSDARLATVREVAAEIGGTPNQTVLAWLMRQTPAMIPLIGPRTFEQYESALPALDLVLTDEQAKRLDEAGA
jgi:aryl-alcohol dehydrogenase-like predicted oxidoreductase